MPGTKIQTAGTEEGTEEGALVRLSRTAPAGRSLDKDGNNLLDFKEFQKAFLKADEK